MRWLWQVGGGQQRRYSTFMLGIVLFFLAACGTPTLEENVFEPVPRIVQSCEMIIQEAIRRNKCSNAPNSVCMLAAEYNPAELNLNRIGSLTAGTLADTRELDSSEQSDVIENGVIWRSYTLGASPDDELPVSLITLGNLTLTGISPELNALELDTSGEPNCENAPPNALLVQSQQGTQASVTVNGAIITVGTTAAITATRGNELTVRALEGLSVVSANGVTRIVRAGEISTVNLRGSAVNGEPSPAIATSETFIEQTYLNILPNPVTPNTRPANTQLQQIQNGNCIPNPLWTDEHTVERGESLARIAPQYGLTYLELQIGNCLQNPSRIGVGQVLRIPTEEVSAPATRPTIQGQPAVIGTEPLISATIAINPIVTRTPTPALTADNTEINIGECTNLRWRVSSANDVFLDETPVTASGSRQVCPQLTTVYALRIVYANGTQETSTTAIFVNTS
jgi:hypothetical protein